MMNIMCGIKECVGPSALSTVFRRDLGRCPRLVCGRAFGARRQLLGRAGAVAPHHILELRDHFADLSKMIRHDNEF